MTQHIGICSGTEAEGDRAELSNRALELANYYAQRPPLAAQMIKRGLNAVQMVNAGVMHMDGDQNALSTLSDDFKEARNAFINKKKD